MPALDANSQFWLTTALVFATLLLGMGSLLLGLFGWPRRIINYEITSEFRLINRHPKQEEKLKVLFDGQEVAKAHLLIMQIENAGNRPIRLEDFDEEIVAGFKGLRIETKNPAAKILTISLAESKSNQAINSRVQVSLLKDSAENAIAYVSAVALNPRESFGIEMILSDASEGIKVSGHVTGFDIKSSQPIPGILFSFLSLILAYVYSTWVYFQHHQSSRKADADEIAALIFTTIALFLSIRAIRAVKRLPKGAFRQFYDDWFKSAK